LLNLVLFMNFVIAILSSTFAYYDSKKLGLYYEVIIGMFSTLDFEERYGFAVCAQPPFNLLILPFQIIMFYPFPEEKLIYYNDKLCRILYFPIALVITLVFSLINMLLVPFAYLAHVYALTMTILNSDETIDELSEKLWRIVTIIKFMIAGPFMMLTSIPVDTYVFFINMYTKAWDADHEVDDKIFTKKSIDILVASINKVIED
jgi:hypothetical protein